MGWREAVIQDMQAEVTTAEHRQLYVDRANNDILYCRLPFLDFKSMLEGYCTTEWGNADCISHASHVSERSIVALTQG
eukprot:3922355-Rhodomonas_salina.1